MRRKEKRQGLERRKRGTGTKERRKGERERKKGKRVSRMIKPNLSIAGAVQDVTLLPSVLTVWSLCIGRHIPLIALGKCCHKVPLQRERTSEQQPLARKSCTQFIPEICTHVGHALI